MAIQVLIILALLFGFFKVTLKLKQTKNFFTFIFIKLPLKGSFVLLIALLLSQGFCGLSYGS